MEFLRDKDANKVDSDGKGVIDSGQALTRVSLSREKSRVEREISLSISKI